MSRAIEAHLIHGLSRLVPQPKRDEWIAEWIGELAHERWKIEQSRALTLQEHFQLLRRALGAVSDVFAVRGLHHAPPCLNTNQKAGQMETIRHDALFAVRMLARKPVFTIMAIATLALGIGSATTIFTILNGVLIEPLAFRDAEQIVTVWQTDTKYRQQSTLNRKWNRLWFTYPQYLAWRRAQHSFAEVAVYGSQEMALTQLGQPAEVVVHTATPTFLNVLGVRPLAGRWFSGGEQGIGSERVAVISHAMWMEKFAGEVGAINRFIMLDDQPFRIVGIMRDDFRLPSLTSSDGNPSIWIPVGSDGGGQEFDSSYEGIARLRSGVSVEQATAETNGIVSAATGKPERGATVVPRLEAETSSAKAPLLLLTAGVGLLLAIACVNIAVLLLGELPAREHEIATRTALGASRSRIIRQLLTENMVLAAVANVIGVALAFAAVRILVLLAPTSMPRMENIHVDARVLLFSVGLTTLAAFGFGLFPALSSSHGRTGESLRVAARQIGSRRRTMQNTAIGAQVAMALVLLSGAATLGQSLQNLARVNPGFVASHVLTLSISPPNSRYSTPLALNTFFTALESRLHSVTGVEAVGAVSNLPLTARNGTTSIELEGVAYAPGDAKPNVQRRAVRSGYFDAMRIPLRHGQGFSGASGEIIVDETMARRLWPNESAIGKRFKTYNKVMTVVGVVGGVRHTRVEDVEQPTMYFPYASMATREMSLVIRTSGDPAALATAVRRAIWSLDPAIPLPNATAMTAYVANSRSAETYRASLIGFFGMAATLLTAVGMVGVTARTVNQQRREIGIRLALGASRFSIAGIVTRNQVASVVCGALVGAAGVRLAAPTLLQFTYHVDPLDTTTMMLALAFLLFVVAAATFAPTRSAVRIEPARLIRDDR